MPTPILFDTDIGSDIDDAVALAYLLAQTQCELLGITTVSGDTKKRAALAEITCRAAGRDDVPIRAGLTGPILHGPGQPNVPQYDAVASRPHRKDPPTDALDFLRHTIRSRPNEITLLAVGPLTNVAALFVSDPETAALLKRVVLMCGVFQTEGPGAREWNALVDPIATAIVFRHAAQKLLSVGLDVTKRCTLPAEDCRRRFSAAGKALGVVAEMAEVWFRHASQITFHDPLAATLIFQPDLCKIESGNVHVSIADDGLAGMTRWSRTPSGASGSHEIAVAVDPDAFFRHYFGVTGG